VEGGILGGDGFESRVRPTSPFDGLIIEPSARPVVELLVVGLVLEAAVRGEELGVDPVALLSLDNDARRETAIPTLVDQLACELAISPADVEARAARYFTDYPPRALKHASAAWRPPRVWPFSNVEGQS
jgi:hypothetical protein